MGQANLKRKKIQAVLDAAVAWADSTLNTYDAASDALQAAIEEYKSYTPPALDPNAPPVDLNAFRCPHCDAERPPYGWHFNIGDTGPFALQWITAFCGECKGVLGVSVIAFLPKQELADQLKKQFAARVNLA